MLSTVGISPINGFSYDNVLACFNKMAGIEAKRYSGWMNNITWMTRNCPNLHHHPLEHWLEAECWPALVSWWQYMRQHNNITSAWRIAVHTHYRQPPSLQFCLKNKELLVIKSITLLHQYWRLTGYLIAQLKLSGSLKFQHQVQINGIGSMI